MIEFNEQTIGLVIAVLSAIAAVWKAYSNGQDNKFLTAILEQINPYSATTNIPDEPRVGDGIWKLGEKQYEEILEGLEPAERIAILSYVNTMESARMKSYQIETSKGTFVIENGYIEDRPKSEPRIIYSSGERIGQFKFLRFEQNIGENPGALDPTKNRLFVVVKPFNVGAMVLGVRVGNEEEYVRAFDAFESKDLHQEIPVYFKLYNYSSTVAGDSVDITVKQGYKRTADDGKTSIVWTEEETHNVPLLK